MKLIWNLPVVDFLPVQEIEEPRDVGVVYTRSAWEVVKDRITIDPVWEADIAEAQEDVWREAAESFRGDVMYAVGGGLAVDAAKYMACVCDVPLFCVPTAITVDAFWTWASGVRVNGCVKYLMTKPPERLIADLDVLGSAPEPLRAAGICDVLSIATGNWDWKHAHEKQKLGPETRFVPYVSANADSILEGALDCAEAAGRGDTGGIKQLMDCLAVEVQLCNQIGHSRPEEGSEHYFAYSVENEMGKGLPHGDLVGPGIVCMAQLQGQDSQRLKRALEACGVPLGNIPRDVMETTLRGLPAYCETHCLPYGIAHEIDEKMIQKLIL